AAGDWPTYRADPTRSGSTETAVTADLKQTWKATIGGRLSAVTVAAGRVFVAQVDAHRLCALDAETGKTAWAFTAGGRIDSPPTIHRGRAYFGCADGRVYCLRAADGAVAWTFRAAPKDYRHVAYEQVASPWPVHGSVLIRDGGLYCVAGRSMFLDGGMRLLKLDPATGKLRYERTLDESDPGAKETLQDYIAGHQMPAALPDVLSGDGKYLYMRTQRFTPGGRREDIYPRSRDNRVEAAMQAGAGVHLFSSIGFLDGSWWHRGYWVWGTRFSQGAGGYPQAGRHAPAGRIMVVGDDAVYGYGRKPAYFTWTTPLEYRLFAADKEFKEVRMPVGRRRRGKKRRTMAATRPDVRWSREVALQARGMVLAGNTLFIAGPPDTVDEEKAFFRLDDEKVRGRLARQAAALAGKEGAVLSAVAAADGKTLASRALPAPPAWDGMAAAGGRLYLAGMDGTVTCLGGEGASLPAVAVAEQTFENPDLVGYWKFDEGEGPAALDSSERQNDAAVRAAWTKGKFGTAVRCDGKTGRVEVPEAACLDITGAITIAAWIKPGDQKNEIPMIVAKLGDQGRYIFRTGKDLRLYGIFFRENARVQIRSDEPLSKAWHHVALTADTLKTKKLMLYVDGKLVKSRDCAQDWGNPAGRGLTISGTGSQAFTGVIDEVRIYNRALSPKEIADLVS
ncbi:MAG: LamG-like jellyroll fold domain-containing protein, partial [Planctomycetota bacterium]|nr:LamG-like jellyroll fold domain-containing protein [Planctomycetota bacterium]